MGSGQIAYDALVSISDTVLTFFVSVWNNTVGDCIRFMWQGFGSMGAPGVDFMSRVQHCPVSDQSQLQLLLRGPATASAEQ